MFVNFNSLLQKVTRKPHGVHSPFLYSFLNSVVFSKPKNGEHCQSTQILERIDRKHFAKKQTRFKNFFSPRINLTRHRRWFDEQDTYRKYPSRAFLGLLCRVCKHLNPNNVVGLGVSPPDVNFCLANAAPKARIICLQNLENSSVEKIETLGKIDLVYFSRILSAKELLAFYDIISKHCHPESVLIVDGIRASKPKKQSWYKMINCSKVTIAVDFFRFGIVFFNQKLSKQIVKVGF